MDKTININLGGTLFTIDEEAYRVLKDYLREIDLKFRNIPGGNETIEDIESRIAEIFISQKGIAGVISIDNVESMISIIGKPEEFAHIDSDGSSSNYSSNERRQRKMFRNPDDTVIAGVCGGIGTYLGTDPVWIRILFILFTFFFGIGFFVYLALWIAIPSAYSEARKKEMYGSNYSHGDSVRQSDTRQYHTTSKIGNAINEVFRALGKVFYIFARIILIIFGTCLVLTGFLALLAFIMVFVFKYPGAFSTDAVGVNISYLPDFLNYIVSPATVPWIKILITAVVSLPLLALIYGGVRLIFWFRARDGYIWLAGFIMWVCCAAALSIILFDEGIGFAESGKTISKEYLKEVPDTLFIKSGVRLSDIKYDKQIVLPDEDYDTFFINDEKKEIYFRTSLNIYRSEDNTASYVIKKRSAGRSRIDAEKRSERLVYNARATGNIIYLDEYFTIPTASKWSFDYVSVTVNVPEGTVIIMDKTTEYLSQHYYHDDYESEPGRRFWIMTDEGLDLIDPAEK